MAVETQRGVKRAAAYATSHLRPAVAGQAERIVLPLIKWPMWTGG